MRTRVGIELTPVACRIVEVSDRGRAWRAQGGDSLVRAFGVWPASGADVQAALSSLRGKVASVVVWGVGAAHRQVEVADSDYGVMRAEALAALAAEGIPTRGAWADIAPAGARDGTRRRVVVAMAEASAMASAVQPLIDAGIRVRTAVTPAAALAAVARSRRAFTFPGAIEVYVALEETATCLAVIRDGALLAARDLPWGFLGEPTSGGEPRSRGEVVSRLGDDLADLFAAYADASRAGHVYICGGLPELRTAMLPLMERFDVEVDTLDSLAGIDAARLPKPADEFLERAAELRLAWAAAADWTTIDLLRARRRGAAQAAWSRAAVVAGVAVGLGGGWGIATSASWAFPAPALVTRAAGNTLPLAPPRFVREIPRLRQEPPIVEGPPPAIRSEPLAIRSEPPAIRLEPPAIRQEPPVVRQVAHAVPMPAARSPVADEAPPFDATLGGILFSSDRQLAIIDGRVVGRGDGVRGATVVDILASAVVLRDRQGRLRRLSHGGID